MIHLTTFNTYPEGVSSLALQVTWAPPKVLIPWLSCHHRSYLCWCLGLLLLALCGSPGL
uniref:Uncharacterized protein n=1 Tax=Arundo donax TaxID=35708 RepID=A0A0A8XRG4_ARUDO